MNSRYGIDFKLSEGIAARRERCLAGRKHFFLAEKALPAFKKIFVSLPKSYQKEAKNKFMQYCAIPDSPFVQSISAIASVSATNRCFRSPQNFRTGYLLYRMRPPSTHGVAGRFRAPAKRFRASAGRLRAAAGRFHAPAGRICAPAKRFRAPARRLCAPAGRLCAPAGRLRAAAKRFHAPAKRFRAPAGRLRAPAGRLRAAAGWLCADAQKGFLCFQN